jgi:hypothetical protein
MYSFKKISEEAHAVLTLNSIEHDIEEGTVEFPSDVTISHDGDEFNQPSYYAYHIGKECFVYPLDTEELVVE